MPDYKCHLGKIMGDDAMHSSISSFKCMAQPCEVGEFGECTDYRDCNADNRTTCQFYLKNQKMKEAKNTDKSLLSSGL